jgi:hypothetical protein
LTEIGARASSTLVNQGITAGFNEKDRDSCGPDARVHAQDVTTSAIEPGDEDDLIAGTQAPQTFEHVRVEDEPRGRCAFVGLTWCDREIG